jgi:alkanesulfonate monooxygenase SsuD/methylene tetrahydromethanopterin reductase-like flavin-dependent oxidoreductase (luciferase family)
MRYAVDVAPLGELSDPREFARVAATAEAAGWDGLSTWDVLATTMGGAADPFVALAAAATATERIRLITSVIVLPRRRPQLVAQSAASLDRLSDGRLTLGVGVGGDRPDFEAFGETWDRQYRLETFDEAARLVDAWLRGGRVRHEGEAFAMRDVEVGPSPVQRPRPPIWLGAGGRPGALRRASEWDGLIAVSIQEDGITLGLTADGLAERLRRLDAERFVAAGHRALLTRVPAPGEDPPDIEEPAAVTAARRPFDIAVFGQDGLGGVRASEFEAAGATWWLESYSPVRCSLDELLDSVAKGPPTG